LDRNSQTIDSQTCRLLSAMIGIAGFSGHSSAFAQVCRANQPSSLQDGPVPSEAANTVVVKGKRAQNRTDRQVYDVQETEEAKSGSAIDVLNTIPGVSVTQDGGLALRGDTNVKVLINGRETALVKGENRALTLLSMSGATISSVEVMTNPSVQFGSDGAAGIINIVTRRDAPLGSIANARVGVEKGEIQSGGLTASRNTGPLTLTLALNGFRNSTEVSTLVDRKSVNLISRVQSRQAALGAEARNAQNFSLTVGADFRPDQKSTFGGNASVSQRIIGNLASQAFSRYDDSESLLSQSLNQSSIDVDRNDGTVDLYFETKGQQANTGQKFDFQYNSSTEGRVQAFTGTPLLQTNAIGSQVLNLLSNETNSIILRYGYVGIFSLVELKTGFEIREENVDLTTQAYNFDLINNERLLDDRLSNVFHYTQRIMSAYGSYDRPIGRKTLFLLGVRIEKTDQKLEQLTQANLVYDQYVHVNPNFHMTYYVSDRYRLRFSYSRRMQRPQPNELNPFLVYRDEKNWSSGNPLLRPQITDGFEFGYEADGSRTNYALRLFYRNHSDVIGVSRSLVNDEVVLTRNGNFGSMRQYGVEGTVSTELYHPVIRFNFTLGLYDVQIKSFDTRGPFTVHGNTIEYKALVSYSPAPSHSFALSVSSQGQRITRDEVVDAQVISLLSYNYRLNSRSNLSASVSNFLGYQNWRSLTRTDVVVGYTARSDPGVVFRLGISYSLRATVGRK
jgi:outer membrane receptor protein involved in Fe transport